MACYFPNDGYVSGGLYSEKRMVRIVGRSPVPLEPFVDARGDYWEPIKVPCRQCLGCRIDYSREWATRCVCESLNYSNGQCWFVTLTYDDDHVPFSENGSLTLNFKDHQDFMKRLRRYVDYHYGMKDVRYYCCGEYGSQTFRPHYHYCIFGLPVDSGVVEAHNSRGDCFYSCPDIKRCWDKGFVVVGEFNYLTAAYTARYVMKKLKGKEAHVYDDLGVEPVFCKMSTHPGIGKDYLDGHLDEIYETDKIILPSVDGKPQVVKPPSYFDKKLGDLDPKRLFEIKEKRKKVAQIKAEVKRRGMTYSEEEYLDIQYDLLQDRLKKLPRIL